MTLLKKSAHTRMEAMFQSNSMLGALKLLLAHNYGASFLDQPLLTPEDQKRLGDYYFDVVEVEVGLALLDYWDVLNELDPRDEGEIFKDKALYPDDIVRYHRVFWNQTC